MDISPSKKWIVVCGKDLPLSKYGFKKFQLLKKTKQSKNPTQKFSSNFRSAFKCISMKVDKNGHIWIHDAVTRCLLTYDSNLKLVNKIQGNPISLCKPPPHQPFSNFLGRLLERYEDERRQKTTPLVQRKQLAECSGYRQNEGDQGCQ